MSTILVVPFPGNTPAHAGDSTSLWGGCLVARVAHAFSDKAWWFLTIGPVFVFNFFSDTVSHLIWGTTFLVSHTCHPVSATLLQSLWIPPLSLMTVSHGGPTGDSNPNEKFWTSYPEPHSTAIYPKAQLQPAWSWAPVRVALRGEKDWMPHLSFPTSCLPWIIRSCSTAQVRTSFISS